MRGAFESGYLVQTDYLGFDSRKGWSQFMDCLILQMVTNPVDAPLRQPSDLFAALTGALIVVIWTLLFQTHTFGHAGFMVRMMIVPISLGWASLAWQVVREDKSIECARER